jgi:disulfide bond formation protein DsbB
LYNTPRMIRKIRKNLLYVSWTLALVSMVGSLFFSEVLKYPPCVLCWYQRICMYPLVSIIAIALIKKAHDVRWYVLPLSIAGLLIALYHNLLYYKLLPESTAPCIRGVSCTTKFIEWFGFVTIPLLSLIAFIIITLGVIFYINSEKNI